MRGRDLKREKGKKTRFWNLIGLVLIQFAGFPISVYGDSFPKRKLSIADVVQLAEQTSPDLKAGIAREKQAKAGLITARSYLYPQFHLSAVDSWGFPGSSMPAPPQYGGLIASPFRAGAGVGLLGKMTLFDFASWQGVEAAKAQTSFAQEQTRTLRLQVDQAALDVFFEAIRYHGLRKVWGEIGDRVGEILTTVKKLVKNGQLAKVQRLLVEDQFQEARMKEGVFEEHYKGAINRLAFLIGIDASTIESPLPTDITEEVLKLSPVSQSPFLTRAEGELQVARAKLAQSSSEHLPKVHVLGSVGVLSDARLVNSDNYSAWVGITLPLFEGFRITSEIQRSQAVTDEKENELIAARLALDEINARYEENIRVSTLQLRLLEGQHQQAIEAFKQSKYRFLSFLGPVVDLRESVRDLARIKTEMNDAKVVLLSITLSKSLVNGGSLSQGGV